MFDLYYIEIKMNKKNKRNKNVKTWAYPAKLVG